MTLMTIGEFGDRTRLSPKALRLYEQLGLVVPREVDSSSGYRRYAEDQVEDTMGERRALVSYLRARLMGDSERMYEVKLRTMPERKPCSGARRPGHRRRAVPRLLRRGE